MKKIIVCLMLSICSMSLVPAQTILAEVDPLSTDVYQDETEEINVINEIVEPSFLEEGLLLYESLSDEERAEKIDMFISQNRKYFPKNKLGHIRETLMGLNETRLKNVLYGSDFKDPTLVLVCSLFLGGLGVDRFVLGEAGLGALKLITIGGLGVWTVIDWFVIMKHTRELNYQDLMELCGQY